MPRNGERGFTLIEILVVLTIIVILAAIAFPMFITQQAKAHDADAKSAATVAAETLAVYEQDHDGFAGVNAAALVELEPSLAAAGGLAASPTADGYTLSVESATGTVFTIERTSDGSDRTCDAPGEGGCPDSGEW